MIEERIRSKKEKLGEMRNTQKELEKNLIEQFDELKDRLKKLFKGENPEDFLPVMATVGGAIKNCWLNGVTPKYSSPKKSESKIYSWAMENQ